MVLRGGGGKGTGEGEGLSLIGNVGAPGLGNPGESGLSRETTMPTHAILPDMTLMEGGGGEEMIMSGIVH